LRLSDYRKEDKLLETLRKYRLKIAGTCFGISVVFLILEVTHLLPPIVYKVGIVVFTSIYVMLIVSSRIEAKARWKLTPKKLLGVNEPCPCGSGKKYKKCCIPR
jgi:tetrahydromethanopterin S-methyltransferase subunit E